jgi:hypothetical protein
MLLPASLCALLAGAIILALACGSHGEAPATPRPDSVTPSGQPVQTRHPGYGTPGERDAGSGASLAPAPPPRSGRPLSRTEAAPWEWEIELAAQPSVPLPGGNPSQPSVPPPVEPPPQPGVPLEPSRPPAVPTTPGAPARPSLPGAPPPPSTPATPTTPVPSISDAGIPDALSPQLPPGYDAGIPIDSGMQPILRRD